jgi:hypothetical protein
MKSIFITLTCFFVLSCSTGQRQEELTNALPDTSFNKSRTSDSSVRIPSGIHLRDTLLKQIHNISPWTITNGSIEIDSSSKFSTSNSQIRYNYSDGISSTDYIVTFTGDKYVDHEILNQSMDMDLSAASYSHKRLQLKKGFQFFVVTYNEFISDTNLLDPLDKTFMKSGYSFDQVKTRTDSIIVAVTIQPDGHIRRDTIR